MSEQDKGMETASVELPAEPKRYTVSRLFILLAGVVLPAITLGFEAFTHASGQSFFDPIPSLLHGLLIALVPLANAWLLVELSRDQPRGGQPLAWLNGLAIGIAAFYAVLYLPMTPFAPFALIFFGLGLLPLAPLLSLLAAWRGRVLLKRRLAARRATRFPPLWRGLALALAVLILIDLPFTLTRIGLQMATSEEATTRLSGVRWLRSVGNEKLLRQLCYPQSGMSTDFIGMLFKLGDPVMPEAARKVYYRVTGTPFNDLPAPVRKGLRDWQWDADQGGTTVGGRLTGVSLAASRLDGSVDADASLAYLEWTLVFRNDTKMQQEGRAQIALPPGAVVSRLTLWIDGEEREAAFGSRAQTRQAYQKVVQRQRDPVLVTTAGKDRVMLQLFPIPPGGGEMKVRLGITVPLVIDDASLAHLQLPAFRERNFEIGPKLRHAVWLAADSPLAGNGVLRQEVAAKGNHALRGELDDEKLGGAGGRIEVPRNPLLRTVWSKDALAGRGKLVIQRFQVQPVQGPRRVAVVVDASHSLAPVAEEIAAAIARLPPSLELGFFPASDAAHMQSGAVTPGAAARALRELDFAGGQDNLEALGKAWDWVAEGSADGAAGAVLWIHGPQPVLLDSVEPLLQRNERRPGLVRLYPVEAVAGANKILEALDHFPVASAPVRSASLQTDLGRRFASWAAGASETRVYREQLSSTAALPESAVKTSDHLARLWAAGQIGQLLEKGDEADRKAATDLALRYHLVTPVSGAVVLETAQQYDEAGLKPVASGSVPTVPEPEEWMLMAAVLMLLFWMLRRRQIVRPAAVA